MANFVNFVHVPENYMQHFETICTYVEIQLLGKLPGDIIVRYKGISLNYEDMELLITRLEWINDKIINLYMVLIQERNVRERLQPVYVFDTLFYTSLVRSGAKNCRVKTSTMKPVFSHNLALMPCHLEAGGHWALIVIDFIERTIQLYDPKFQQPNVDLRLIRRFLLTHCDKLGLRGSFPDFDTYIAERIPKQKNSSDCGVYTMVYAEFLSRNVHPQYMRRDAQFYRKKIHLEILGRKITARV